MTHVLTLVASAGNPDVSKDHIKAIGKIIAFYNVQYSGKPEWLSKTRAVDLAISDAAQGALTAHLHDFLKDDKIDVFTSPLNGRQKSLLLADMDSTIVEGETLDELAAYAGIKDQIAAITQAAMEGKLDFHEALRERVALLEGLGAEKLQETLEKTLLNPGAQTLVQTMRQQGATCVLVSGGFTFFTGAIAEQAGFDFHHGNILEIKDEKLTGKVQEPILDKYSKVNFLKEYLEKLSLEEQDCLTLGDGANDIPMLKAAGMGIGYRPKPAVAEEIQNIILYGDLSAALYAQGYRGKLFQTSKAK